MSVKNKKRSAPQPMPRASFLAGSEMTWNRSFFKLSPIENPAKIHSEKPKKSRGR